LILVAAAAAVPNIATRAAAIPISFIFIAISHSRCGGPSATPTRLRSRHGLKVNPLDLQADLKVF
jgi:hypothetical protein